MVEVLRRSKLQLAIITQGEDPKIRKLIKDINAWQLAQHVPKNFDNESPDYYIKNLEKSFESLCATLEDLGVQNPKGLTIFEYYSRLEYFKKKKKPGGRKTSNHEHV
jgi:hypothetical protein